MKYTETYNIFKNVYKCQKISINIVNDNYKEV